MSKIRKSAKLEDCTAMIPGICCGNPETVVWAHLRRPGTGMGRKPNDLAGLYACHTCHAEIDRRTRNWPVDDLAPYILSGHLRSLELLDEKGLI